MPFHCLCNNDCVAGTLSDVSKLQVLVLVAAEHARQQQAGRRSDAQAISPHCAV